MNPRRRFCELLEQLGVEPGALIYLHSSMRYLKHLEMDLKEILTTLLEYLGPTGTLVLPSFAWNLEPAQRPWNGYRMYFEAPPVFDVRNTRANIGALPEIFRNQPGVERSVHPWWSVAACGPLARKLTMGQEKVCHPFGPGSTFDLLRLADVRILGLGVSLNTTSLALLPDFALANRNPHQVFTEKPRGATVVDHAGRSIESASYWLLPEVVRCIQPSRVFLGADKTDWLARIDVAESIHFSYPYRKYHEEALRQAEDSIATGRPLPWLTEYPMRPKTEPKR